jgi:hypothetical protein
MDRLGAKIVRVVIGARGRKNVGRSIRENLGFDVTEKQAQRIWDEGTQPAGPPITFSNLAHIQHMVKAAEQLSPTF